MMQELIVWLRAWFDEDERILRASIAERHWGLYPDGHGDGTLAWLDAWREERCLAEVAAKRKIVDYAESWAQTLHQTPSGHTAESATAFRMALTTTLRYLAMAGSDRAGYQEGWRP